jgi:hypothetical protein
LRIQRRRGVKLQIGGLGLAAIVVPFVIGGVAMPWTMAAPIAASLAFAGTIMFARGTIVVSRMTRRLAAAKQIRALPAARVVAK